MESTGIHPYTKLTQTPLAQQTNVCGIPARTASVVVGLFALVVVSGSHFILGAIILRSRPTTSFEDNFNMGSRSSWSDSFMEDSRKRHEDMFNNSVLSVVGGMAIFSGIITTISGIVVLIGALQVKPPLFIPWFITMFFGIFLGRLVPVLTSLIVSNSFTKFFALMFVVDIVTIILVVICWGQLAGVLRNNRYKNWALTPRFTVKPGGNQTDSGQVLLPPGSYPRQEV